MLYQTKILDNPVTIEYQVRDDYVVWEEAIIWDKGLNMTETYVSMLSQRELNAIEDQLNADYQLNRMVADDPIDLYWNDSYHYMGGQP